jgi:DNA-binding response OmpR family regulator
MPSSPSGAQHHEGGQVGGARADFVASLGRKVNDARELLALLEEDPSSKPPRDELRRRVYALGTGARLLRFDAMTHSLQEVLAVLDRGTQAGALREEDVDFVAQVLDDLPALAWAEIPPRNRPSGSEEERADESTGPVPIAVLIVGGEPLADAFMEDAPTRARAFECERTDDAAKALEMARAYAPDVAVVDTDTPHGAELVEALLEDPLTDPVPVVVVGTSHSREEAARFIALGVARTLTKPVVPELLRATCSEIIDARDGPTTRVTLGEPTLEQLADRLAEELKRGLVDSVDRPARSSRVPLGEGTEVLGALWGAIARVQEIVTQKTGGTIRFGGEAPEGAIALAPWLHQDLPGADRFVGRGRGAAAEVRLNGRRVVVADDDPGVTWFISDLLRTAGCEVYETLDGATALDVAFRVEAELVVSDILMPGLDGFALCRALRRDVALRDTPVILLSWKEDLLQRVRELGASAAGYMRKESGSRAILARVREVLRPRARIETRLHGEGEVRGRLDGLTPRLLLDLTCQIRKNARVCVRDATYLYEVEVRRGTPRKATRTASDGSYLSGERALASLLGVGAGRFVVTPSSEPIHGELTGTLFDQLARPVAIARGALAATTGARTMNVERIFFDDQALEEYLHATPEPTRTLIKALAQGIAPRQLLLRGDVSPSLLEDVLSDLAARGAIRAVQGANGADLLSPEVAAALVVLRGAGGARQSLSANVRPGGPEHTAAERTTRASAEPSDKVPASLEDAVMREISDRSTEAETPRELASDPPPIVEPSELRPRSSNPPTNETTAHPGDDPRMLPSTPPDAVVPETSTSEVREQVPGAAVAARSTPRAWRIVLSIGLLGVAVAAVLHWMGEEREPPRASPNAAPSAPTATPTSSATQAPAMTVGVPSASAGDELPPGAEVPPGFGLVEVWAPPGAIVRVDGNLAGSGPYVSAVEPPGNHEVRVEQHGRESKHAVEVHIGKTIRVRSLLAP